MKQELKEQQETIWNTLENETTLKELKQLTGIDKLTKNDIKLVLTEYCLENDNLSKDDLSTRINNIKSSGGMGKRRMNPRIGKNGTLLIPSYILNDLGINNTGQRYKVSKERNKIILTKTNTTEYKPS